jgi:hypothetical protein
MFAITPSLLDAAKKAFATGAKKAADAVAKMEKKGATAAGGKGAG